MQGIGSQTKRTDLMDSLVRWAWEFAPDLTTEMAERRDDRLLSMKTFGRIFRKRSAVDRDWFFAIACIVPSQVMEISSFIGQIEFCGYAFPPAPGEWRQWLSAISLFPYHGAVDPWNWDEGGKSIRCGTDD